MEGPKPGAYTRPLFGSTYAHFVGYVWVHDFPPVYETGGHGEV